MTEERPAETTDAEDATDAEAAQDAAESAESAEAGAAPPDAERATGPGRPGDVGDRLEALLSEHRDDAPTPKEDQPVDPFDPFAPVQPQGEAAADQDEGDGLPDAPLFALLGTLAEEITPGRIDRVWIFPPRRIETGETAVVVVAAFTPTDSDRRRVYAAHYTALDDSDEHRLAVDEYGTAPAERVGRLVEEVVERIKEGPTGAPRSVRIEGRERTWNETLHELAEAYLEERQKDPRIRR